MKRLQSLGVYQIRLLDLGKLQEHTQAKKLKRMDQRRPISAMREREREAVERSKREKRVSSVKACERGNNSPKI